MILFLGAESPGAETGLLRSLGQQTSDRWTYRSLPPSANAGTVHQIAVETGANYVAVAAGSTVYATTMVEQILATFNDYPDVAVVYSDEIYRGAATPWVHLKPGWSPERFAVQDYLGDAVWMRTQSLADLPAPTPLGKIRSPILATAAMIAHVPDVLVSTDAGSPSVRVAGSAGDHDDVLVSVIIPTAAGEMEVDGENRILVHHAVDSLVRQTRHQQVEIIVVQDRSCSDAALAPLSDHAQVRVVKNVMPFNFSQACNLGASFAGGDVLVFLNDDTECLEPRWIEPILHYCLQPQVGAVGPHLLFEDGRIQHAGIWARDGIPGHRYSLLSSDLPGVGEALRIPQNCLAVTGACLGVETAKFHSVGGFDPRFPANFNDVDICLRLLDRGWRTVVEPTRSFTHFESATRSPAAAPEEYSLLERLWGDSLRHDFWDNPGHVAPAPNEYPSPQLSFIESRQAARRQLSGARVWDGKRHRPLAPDA